MKQLIVLIIISNFYLGTLYGQIKTSGPVINDYGHVWDVDPVDFPTDTSQYYKVVFDIYDAPENRSEINPQINTIARFLNMHVNAGISRDKLKVAAVFHNKASQNILKNEHYLTKHGVTNPNQRLINELLANDVELFFCGQSSYSRKVPKSKIIDGIDIALSAMTVLLDYTNKGYTIIKF